MLRQTGFAIMLTFALSGQAQTLDYERILFPVVMNGSVPGAFGAQWRSELSILNVHPSDGVPLRGSYACFHCRLPGPFPLLPNRTYTQVPPAGTGGIPGSFLLVEKGKADLLRFGLRVRDVSAERNNLGAELPVVREREFLTDKIELLGVPLSPLYRQHLRIYILDPVAGEEVLVRAYSQPLVGRVIGGENEGDPDVLLGENVIASRMVTSQGTLNNYPGFAEITSLPIGSYAGTTVRLELIPLRPGARLWGFLTVTNNTTNEFTVVSPQ